MARFQATNGAVKKKKGKTFFNSRKAFNSRKSSYSRKSSIVEKPIIQGTKGRE